MIQNLLFSKNFQHEIWRVVIIFSQNMRCCQIFNSKSDTLSPFHSQYWNLNGFAGSVCVIISSVNFEDQVLYREKAENIACHRIGCQMYKWKRPNFKCLLNLGRRALWKHTFLKHGLRTELCEARNVADQQFFSKHTTVKGKEFALQMNFYNFSPINLFWQQGKKQGKEGDTYIKSTDVGCRTLLTTVLTVFKSGDSWLQVEIQDMCGWTHTLGLDSITHLRILQI